MNFNELKNIEEAFYIFLRKIKKKSIIKVEYYEYSGKNGKLDFSFIGYETRKEGLHGIHYNKQKHSYSFGTRSLNGDSWITGLTTPQDREIPSTIKDAFIEVANSKRDKIIKKSNDSKLVMK